MLFFFPFFFNIFLFRSRHPPMIPPTYLVFFVLCFLTFSTCSRFYFYLALFSCRNCWNPSRTKYRLFSYPLFPYTGTWHGWNVNEKRIYFCTSAYPLSLIREIVKYFFLYDYVDFGSSQNKWRNRSKTLDNNDNCTRSRFFFSFDKRVLSRSVEWIRSIGSWKIKFVHPI